MKTRIYRVNDTLIRAATQAAAVHHLVKQTIRCRVATQEDIADLIGSGSPIQEAGKDWIDLFEKKADPGSILGADSPAVLTADEGKASLDPRLGEPT